MASNISKGPIDQLKPNLSASSISLYSSVIWGTNEEAYKIILEITDHAYFPYLSFLFISSRRLTLSIFKSIFFDGKYSFLIKSSASNIFLPSFLFNL